MADIHALTANQRDLWLDQQLYGTGIPYHIGSAIEIEGPLDTAHLVAATKAAVTAHDSLQLVFSFDGLEPRGQVHADFEPDVPIHDFSDYESPRTAAFEAMQVDQGVPFEEGSPQIRFAIYRLSPTHHLWYGVFHHLTADGWGWFRVMAFIMQSYNRLCRGQTAPPAPPAFLDQISREVAYQQSRRYQRDGDYWRERLSQLPQAVELPETEDLRSARVQVGWDQSQWRRCAQLAEDCGVSPFQVMVGLFGLYLGRAYRSDGLALRLPILNRGSALAKRTAGMFTGEKPLALNLNPKTSFRELVRAVGTDLRRDYRHQAFPLGALAETGMNKTRLGRFSLSFQQHRYEETLDGCRCRIHQLPPTQQLTALTLSIHDFEESGRVYLDFDYQHALMSRAMVEDLAAGIAHLLTCFAQDPDLSLVKPSLLPLDRLIARERVCNQAVPPAQPQHWGEMVRRVARADGGKAALWSPDATLDYASLDRDSDRVATQLRDRFGIGVEMPVAVDAAHNADTVVAVLGVLKAGGVLVPLDPNHPPARRRMMLTAAGCRLLLGHDPQPIGDAIRVCSIKSLREGETTPTPPPLPDLCHSAYLLFTSGSTGTPKCCRISLANLGNWIVSSLDLYRNNEAGHHGILHGSLVFDARLGSMMLALAGGGSLTLPPEDLDEVSALQWACESETPADVLDLTPTHLDMLIEQGVGSPRIRRIMCGGEVLTADLLAAAARHFPNAHIYNLYGPTEATIECASALVQVGRPIHLGKPNHGTSLYVLDDQGRPLPRGVAGEMVIGGAGVGRGYDGDPARTAEMFVPDPFTETGSGRLYRTGDLVRRTENGTYTYLGRLDHQLKINGQRIDPAEVEAVLQRHPAVLSAAVLPYRRGRDKVTAAFVVTQSEIADETLRQHCRDQLSAAWIPAFFMPIESMPRTSSGKIDRRRLTQQLAEIGPSPNKTAMVAPCGPWECKLAELCRPLLAVAHVDMSAAFYDLGGNSLTAVRLATAAYKRFGIRLRIRDILRSPDLAALADIMAEATPVGRPTPVPKTATPQDLYPMTPGQEALWFHQKLNPESAAYHMPGTLNLRGTLNTEALIETLTDLQRRYPALRMRVTERDGRVGQRFVEETTAIPMHRLTAAQAEELTARETVRPFDLEGEAPVRIYLLRLAPDHHRLLLVFHHIACDGHALQTFFKALTRTYNGLVRGDTVLAIPRDTWPDLLTQQIHRPVDGKGLAFWRRRLADLQRPELPLDRARPAKPDFHGAHHRFSLGKETVRKLESLSRSVYGAGFCAFSALIRLLLFRLTNHGDLTLGTPYLGRETPESTDAFGYLVTNLVLRNTVGADQDFHTLLASEADAIADALENPPPVLEDLAETLEHFPEPGRTPFFDVMVVYEHDLNRDVRLTGLQSNLVVESLPVAKMDLVFAALPRTDGALEVTISYRDRLFDKRRVAAMASDLRRLADAVTAAPHKKLGAHLAACRDLDGDTAPSLSIFDGGPSPAAHETVIDVFERMVAANPKEPALIDDRRRLDYDSLNRMANGLAAHLVAQGIGPEDRVGLLCRPDGGQIIAALGILKAGAAYLPLDPEYPRARLAWMLEDAALRAVVCDAETLALAASLTSLPAVVYADLSPQPEAPDVLRHPDQAAFLIYTSGTTGRPKAAVQHHGGFANITVARARDLGMGPGDVYPLILSFSYDAAQLTSFTPLVGGAALLCAKQDRDDPEAFARLITREKATHLVAPPAYFALLETMDVPSLRVLISGGEAPDPRRVRAFLQRYAYINDYGPCEASVMVCRHRVAASDDLENGVPLGRPPAGVRLYLLDTDLHAAVPGQTGEIAVAGAAPGRGYHGQAALTAERWRPDPYSDRPGARLYLTGDLAEQKEDGRIFFRGRRDDQVKIRGNRVTLGEVEQRLASLPNVAGAAVIARPSAGGSSELIAYYIPSGDTRVAPRDALRRLLPEPMIPAHFIALEQFPLTANGKIDRRALPVPELSHASVEPLRDAFERDIASVWAQVLGVPKIGRDSDFFELGGQSLSAMRVAAQLRRKFHRRVAMRDLFERPVLAEFAERLRTQTEANEPSDITPLPPAEDYPLSFAQRRLWVLHRMGGGDVAYNMPGLFLLEGAVDETALERAFQSLFARHEALRTVFSIRNGEPRQSLLPSHSFHLDCRDYRNQPDAARLAHEAGARDAVTPFDLTRGPLIRATLMHIGPQRSLLSVCLHHIVCDGWSLRIMTRELFDFYRDPRDRQPLSIHYKDVAAWQTEGLTQGRCEASRHYWHQRFNTPAPALEWATDRPYAAETRFDGACLPMSIPSSLGRRLLDLAQSRHCGPFVLLQALVKVLLFRHTHQTDLVIGVPVAGRDHAGLDNQVGFYVNMLPLRDQLDPNGSFWQLLTATRENAAEAMSHQSFPFDLLVDELSLQYDGLRNPLFDVVVAYEEGDDIKLRLPGLSITQQDTAVPSGKFDLTFVFETSNGVLNGALEYNQGLFNAWRMEALVRQFVTLATAVCAGDQAPLTRLPIHRPEDIQKRIEQGRGDRLYLPDGADLTARLYHWANAAPQQVAVVADDGTLTYAMWLERASRLAALLRAAGVAAEDRVAVLMRRSCDLPVAWLGVWLSGAALVPLDPDGDPRQLGALWRQAGGRVLVCGDDTHAGARQIAGAAALSLSQTNTAPVLSQIPQRPATGAAYVIFTSGTTGTPKGVVMTNAAVTNLLANYQQRYFARVAETGLHIASFSPSFFDPSIAMIFAPPAYGHQVHLTPERALDDVHAAAAFLKSHRIQVVDGTPGLLAAVHDCAGFNPECRLIISGGEALPPSTAAHLRSAAELHNAYGPTETCVDALSHRMTEEDVARGEVPVGTPLYNLEAYILDRDGQLAPQGAVGELCIGGMGLARGYLGRPRETAEVFVPHPFRDGARLYRSGDLVRRREDGVLLFLGRRDAQVKVHGFRIELAHVEDGLRRLPGVQDAAVRLVAGYQGEAQLVGYLVFAESDQRLSNHQWVPENQNRVRLWRKALATHLPRYMIPDLFMTLPTLPRSSTGKLDRTALPVATRVIGGEPARNPLERQLCALWVSVLDCDSVGIFDDFYRLGGQSLKALRLAARIHDTLGVQVGLAEVLANPTVAEQAELLRKRAKAKRDRVPKQPDADTYPVSHAQRRMWVLDRLDPAAYHMPAAYELLGPLDVGALDRALTTVTARHEALRTTFIDQNGEPRQRIQATANQRVKVHACTPDNVEEQVAVWLQQPFDTAVGPLVRLALFRFSNQRHLLLVSIHHIIADEWSIGVLGRELAESYRAFRNHEQPRLPELTLQHRDFSAFAHQQLASGALDEDRRFWLSQLAGSLPVLALPGDEPRPARQSFAGSRCQLTIDAETTRALTELAVTRGKTPFVVAATAAFILLQRHSGQTEILAGVPISNRDRTELDDQIGLYLNTLVLRTHLAPTWSFNQAVDGVADTFAGAVDHRAYPFDLLVDELDAARDLSRNPVFQAMMVLQENENDILHFDGLRSRPFPITFDKAKCDVTFFFRFEAGRLQVMVEYAAFLGDTRMQRFAQQFKTLLSAAVSQPTSHLGRLPLLTPDQEQALIAETDRRHQCQPIPVLQQLAAQVTAIPDAVAVIGGETTWSYQDLAERIDALVSLLQHHGVGPEAVVGVALPRGPWLPVAFLAVLRVGGVYLPLDPGFPEERLRRSIRHTGCRRIIALSRPGWAASDVQILSPETPLSEPPLPHQHHPDQLAYMITTSGSTGAPKAVACTHRCLDQLVTWNLEVLGRRKRVAAFAPLGFDVSVQEMLVTLCGGGTLHMLDETQRLDLPRLAGYLVQQRIQMITMPFSALALLAEELVDCDLTHLHALCTSGEALHRTDALDQLLQTHPHLVLHNQYGPAETHVVTAGSVTPEDPVAAPIGRPIDGNAVYLLDEHLQPVPAGVTGELFLAGEGLARGYVADPSQTADRFRPDPFGPAGARMYRTGDLGRLLPDGRFAFLGRNDHQVKIRGFRVEPAEVSHALRELAGVCEAVTTGVTLGSGRELAAYVTGPDPAEAPNLLAALRGRLPAFMVPTYLTVLDHIPRLPSGKFDMRALPRPETVNGAKPARQDADPLAQRLLDLWVQTLGRKNLNVDDDFFAAGGHSLKAMQLVAALRKTLQSDVGLVDIFEAPSPTALAHRLRRLQPARYAPLCAAPPRVRYPLSPGQRRLWLLQRLAPESHTYHVPVALHLRGPLDEAALTEALGDCVERHAILRTRFPADGDAPYQVIDPPSAPVIGRHGLAEGDALSLLAAFAQKPFRLEKEHPLRIDWVSNGHHEHWLLLCFHHIAADGWSLTPLLNDLSACYQARQAGGRPDLAPLPVQVYDVAVFQNDQQHRQHLSAVAEEIGLSLGRENPPPMEGDFPRPERFCFDGANLDFTLSEEDSAAVFRLAQAEGLTPFVILLGAFQLVLAQRCRGRIPRIGTPVANRDRDEMSGLIGFFVNTLVIDEHLETGESGRAFLHRLRKTVTQTLAHRDLPFEALVEWLQPTRDPSRHPLFDISFAYQGRFQTEGHWGEVAWSAVNLDHQTTKFDLTLSMVDVGGVLHGNCEYARALFKPETIDGLADQFQTVLRALCEEIGGAVANLPVLSRREQQRILAAVGAPLLVKPTHQGVHHHFEATAARFPNRTALSFEGEHLCYQDLERRANRLAHALIAAGVGPETRVALLIEPSFTTVIAILAVLKAGGAYLPLDPRQPSARLAVILEDAQPLLLLHHGVPPENVPSGLCRTFDVETMPTAPSDHSPTVPITANNAAYVIYTSGSTGQPKGVVIAHRQVMQLFAAADALFEFDQHDVWSLFHAYSFDFSVWELWGALTHGARLVIVPYWLGRTPGKFLEMVRTEGVTVLSQTPSAFTQLAAIETESPLRKNEQPRYVVFGGEALDVSAVHAWQARHDDTPTAFINMYGITETCVHVTFQRVEPDTAQGLVGSAMPHLSTLVCDPFGRLLPFGVTGEILVAGGGLARGYLNRPALTAERFRPHPFPTEGGERIYHSGDIGTLQQNGRLIHQGRADSQVQIRGYRIELGEVRAALAEHPQISDAAVVAVGEQHPALVAYIQYKQPGLEPGPDLRTWLEQRLPAYMVPAHFVVLADLPLTVNGKLDQTRLPAPDPNAAATTDFAPPRGEVERFIAGIWETVLERGPVGRHDDFFALGGHSLAAARVTHRIHARLGIEVSLRAFFDAPTLMELATLVETAGAEEVAHNSMLGIPLPALPEDTPVPASHAQKRMWFLAQIEDQAVAYNMPHSMLVANGLDPQVLAQAVTALAERHHALRSVLHFENGFLSQKVLPAKSVRLVLPTFVDDTGMTPEEWARRWCEQDAHRPFDLAEEPPLRVAYLAMAKAGGVLYLNVHHAAGDGWSMGIIVRELGVYYRFFRDETHRHQAHPPELSLDPLQVAAFAGWQSELLKSERLNKQRDFWLKRLQPLAPPLALPLDFPRPAVRTYRGDRRHHIFSADQATALNQLAHQHGAGLFLLLTAVVKTLLFRYSGQTDFVLGTPVAARPHPRLESLVGCLVNTLPLRDPFSPEMPFSALLKQTRAAVLSMLDNQLYPFEQLVDDLGLTRDTSRPVLFDVMLVMQNAAFDPPDFDEGPIRDFTFDFRTAKFDLLLNFWEDKGQLHLNLEFNADLFEASRIERMFTHLTTLFDAVCAAPDTPLQQLPLLAEKEQQTLYQWSRGPQTPKPTSLVTAFLQRVAIHPDKEALIYEHHTLTYRDVDAWSAECAGALQQHGVRAGNIVTVCLPREYPVAVYLMAVLRLGATYAYLDPADPERRRRRFIEEIRPAAVITHRPDPSLPEEITLIPTEKPPATRPTFIDVVAPPTQAAYLIYTSGSTGQPKAVLGTYGCLENLMAWQQDLMGSGLRCLGFAALGFDVSVQEMLFALVSGGSLVNLSTVSRLDMTELAEVVEKHRVACAIMPYTPLSLFVRANQKLPASLRWLVTSGEQLRLDQTLRTHLASHPDLILHNQYGPSETHVVTAAAVRGGVQKYADLPPIGTPLPNTLSLVLTPSGAPAPIGVPGELYLGGAHVALGYDRKPRLTAAAFVPAPPDTGLEPGARLYRTGDRCLWNQDGTLQFLGRMDDQVKIRGFRVEPGEVAATLADHPHIDEAAVIADNRQGQRRLVAYYVPTTNVTEATLRAWLRERLPSHMVPEILASLEQLPMNANGKLDRKALPKIEAGVKPVRPSLPSTGTPRRIAEIWQAVLAVNEVGLHDAFFEVGGNSFSLIEVHRRLKEAFGDPLPVVKLFEHTTIAELAAYLDHRKPAQPRRVSTRGHARRQAAAKRRR